jgi:hypothetical protein
MQQHSRLVHEQEQEQGRSACGVPGQHVFARHMAARHAATPGILLKQQQQSFCCGDVLCTLDHYGRTALTHPIHYAP